MRIVGYALFRPPIQIMNGLLSIRTLGPSYRGAPHLTVRQIVGLLPQVERLQRQH